MSIKLLGICGSHVKGGNTEHFLKEALKAAEEEKDVLVDTYNLAGRKIQDCIHCNWCVSKQREGEFCAIKDDLQDVFPKVLDADGLLLATPVYLGRLTGLMASFFDRMRVFAEGKYYRGSLKNKVGGALAVAWFRHGGIESALISILYGFLLMEMIPASVPGLGALYGAGGLSSARGEGKHDPENRLVVLEDEWGLKGARAVVRRMLELIQLTKLPSE